MQRAKTAVSQSVEKLMTKSMEESLKKEDARAEEEEEIVHLEYLEFYESHPCTTYCYAWCGFALFLILILIVTGAGETVFEFRADVPMYLRDHRAYERQSAFEEAIDVANAPLTDSSIAREREASEWGLTIIYEVDGRSTMLTPDVLNAILRFEQAIVNDPRYSDFCQLTYENENTTAEEATCLRHTSVLNFFDPDYFAPNTAASGVSVPDPTVPSLENAGFLDQSGILENSPSGYVVADPYNASFRATATLINDASDIELVADYWGRYCFDASVCGAFENANLSASPFAYTFADPSGELLNATVGNLFWSVADSNYGLRASSYNPNARALRSEFFFGAPQRRSNGLLYGLDSDDLDDQEAEIGEWLFEDGIHDMLVDANKYTFDDTGDGLIGDTIVWWSSDNGLEDLYTFLFLQEGIMFACFALVFVFLYSWYMLGSLFLGGAAVSMIVANFLPAIFLYRFIGGYTYFGVLNILGIFIILGIGVDDVFVLTDTWRAKKIDHPDLRVSDLMSVTILEAGKAMATTSASTAFSFLANATSQFPAVYTFGTFLALLVACNFFSVVIMYPAVILVNEYYFAGSKWCPFRLGLKPSQDWNYKGVTTYDAETEVEVRARSAAAAEGRGRGEDAERPKCGKYAAKMEKVAAKMQKNARNAKKCQKCQKCRRSRS